MKIKHDMDMELKELDAGDCFRYMGEYWIKSDTEITETSFPNSTVNRVLRLDEGTIEEMSDATQVRKVYGEVMIK